jgi:hypothetical protein
MLAHNPLFSSGILAPDITRNLAVLVHGFLLLAPSFIVGNAGALEYGWVLTQQLAVPLQAVGGPVVTRTSPASTPCW